MSVGEPPSDASDQTRAIRRGNGDGMHTSGEQTQHEKPQRWRRETPNGTPVRDRPGRYGWRTGP